MCGPSAQSGGGLDADTVLRDKYLFEPSPLHRHGMLQSDERQVFIVRLNGIPQQRDGDATANKWRPVGHAALKADQYFRMIGNEIPEGFPLGALDLLRRTLMECERDQQVGE